MPVSDNIVKYFMLPFLLVIYALSIELLSLPRRETRLDGESLRRREITNAIKHNKYTLFFLFTTVDIRLHAVQFICRIYSCSYKDMYNTYYVHAHLRKENLSLVIYLILNVQSHGNVKVW